jgi:hypothetical protein
MFWVVRIFLHPPDRPLPLFVSGPCREKGMCEYATVKCANTLLCNRHGGAKV